MSQIYPRDEKDSNIMSDKPSVSEKAYGVPADATPDTESNAPQDQGAVFATGQDVEFRGVTWIGAAFLIAKSQFGLGVLGIPFTFMSLGFVPGMITLVFLSVLSTWTGIIVGDFRNKHQNIHSVGDAADALFGRVGREFMGVTFWLLYTFCYGAAALTVGKAFTTLSDKGLCNLAFVGIAAAISLVLGLATRTLKWMSYASYVALVSVFVGVWVTAIACLAQDRPHAAPEGVVNKDVKAFVTTSIGAAMSQISGQLFSLGGTASFFSIHAEMENPLHYRRSLYLGQGFVVINYIVVSAIMYGRVGQYITSPALASAGPLIAKVAYGLSLPALFFSCFFQAHLSAKYMFVRMLRNTRHLQSNTMVHWGVWFGNMLVVIIVGFIIACAIPFFGDLVGLIGAFLMPSFVIIVPVCLLLYSIVEEEAEDPTRGRWWLKSWSIARRKGGLTAFYVVVSNICVVIGLFIFVVGTYGSIDSIATSYASGAYGKAFKC